MRYLETFFATLAQWAQNMSERCAICPDCGHNRYTGAPCKGGE